MTTRIRPNSVNNSLTYALGGLTIGNSTVTYHSSNSTTLLVNTTITANGTVGSTGQVLASNGTGVYWTSAAGYSGSIGFTGSIGYSGSSGFNGSIGYSGSFGYTGSIGIGYTGSASTAAGYTGSQGTQGDAGYTGSTGIGYSGSQGIIGYTGSPGTGGGSGGFTNGQTIQVQSLYVNGAIYDHNSSLGTYGQFLTSDGSGNVFWTTSTGGGGGPASVYISDTPPGLPTSGTLWYYSVIGEMYIYYVDVNGGKWVTISTAGVIPSVGTSAGTSTNILAGYTGSIGVGYTGSSGAAAAVGYTGSTGNQGPAGGYTGSSGYNGSQGLQGYSGSSGYTGSASTAPGYTGSQGQIGYTGSSGPQGPVGYLGPLGYTGSSGAFAALGYTGSSGSTGYTGSISTAPGYTGSVGLGYTGSVGGTVIPFATQVNTYTLKASDTGSIISTSNTITVPGGVFTAGQNVTIYNNSLPAISILQGTGVTMYFVSSVTGNRYLGGYGLATVTCVGGNTFVISGGTMT